MFSPVRLSFWATNMVLYNNFVRGLRQDDADKSIDDWHTVEEQLRSEVLQPRLFQLFRLAM